MRVRAFGVVVAVFAAVLPAVTAGPAAAGPAPSPIAPVTTDIPLDLAAAAQTTAAESPDTASPDAVSPDTAPPADSATTLPGTVAPDPEPVEVAGPQPVTIEHATDGTFSAIGFRFDPTAATPGIEVRVREGGAWTGWETVGLPDGGPDAGSPEAAHAAAVAPDPTTEPLLTTRADAFQVRVSPTDGVLPTGFAAVTVDPGTSAYDAVVAETPAGTAPAAAPGEVGGVSGVSAAGAADIRYPSPAPGIVSRAQWGADEGIRTADPDCVNPRYDATVKIGFVHHTASTNSYDATTALENIRAIYAYDAQVLGWCDIAYNFLVDKYGRIFEGRYGGVDRPVHGTHTGGFNTNTFAVAALGNYQEIPPTTVMVSSIAHVLGWKLGLYHRNVYGQDTLTSAGGGTSRYAAGVSVTFNVISGHRDPGATLCPGQYLYDRLASIRSGAAPIAAQVLRNYTAVSSVTPRDQQVAYGTRAKWSAFLQVSSSWTLTITEACSGQVVRRYTGFYSERGTVKFDWDLRNSAGGLVRGGAYSWSWQTAIGGSASGSIDVMPAKETAAAGTGTASVTNAGFVPISPVRVYDSRTGGKQPLGANSSRSITVAGVGGVPTSGVAAVALNVTATCSTQRSYLTAWSTGTAKPATSSLNFAGTDAVPGMVVAPVGTGGAVNLYNSAGSADVIVDVVGYFTTTGGSGYRSVTPTRVLDGWSTPMKAGQARVLAVAQQLGVPAGQLTGVAVNVTIAGAPAPGYVQLSPGSGTTTATSTANVSVGQDVANRAFVGVANGQLTVRLAGTSAAVFVDIVGYFTTNGTGARYTSVSPTRVLDTRNGTGATGALAAGQTDTVSMSGAAVPSNATSVLATLTSDQTTTKSYLVAYGAGSPRPKTSDLNPWPGVTKANVVVAAMGSGRSVTIYNNQGKTAVLLDVVGYFR